MNSPQVDRVESQLLLHPSGSHAGVFLDAGFQVHQRLFMVRQLEGFYPAPRISLPATLELRSWREEDLNSAARLISRGLPRPSRQRG